MEISYKGNDQQSLGLRPQRRLEEGQLLPLEDPHQGENWLRVEAITIDTIPYHFSNQTSTTGNQETTFNMGNCLTSHTLECHLVRVQYN